MEWKKRFTYLKNIVFEDKDLRQQGAKFQVVRFLPQAMIGPHAHQKVAEIFFVREGEGKFLFNGKPVIGRKDDMFLCEPGDVHEIINTGAGELVLLIFKTNEDPADITWLNPGDEV